MTSRWIAFAAGAVAVLGAGAWALGLFSPKQISVLRTSVSESKAPTLVGAVVPAASAALQGAAPARAPAIDADRFRLVGVMASGPQADSKDGIALIAVDGKPARTFRVGAVVEADIVLRDVTGWRVTLGAREGGPGVVLEMAPVAASGAAPGLAPQADSAMPRPLNDGSAQSREILRKLGAKNAPLPARSSSAPKRSDDRAVPSEDDGRWKPPGG